MLFSFRCLGVCTRLVVLDPLLEFVLDQIIVIEMKVLTYVGVSAEMYLTCCEALITNPVVQVNDGLTENSCCYFRLLWAEPPNLSLELLNLLVNRAVRVFIHIFSEFQRDAVLDKLLV